MPECQRRRSLRRERPPRGADLSANFCRGPGVFLANAAAVGPLESFSFVFRFSFFFLVSFLWFRFGSDFTFTFRPFPSRLVFFFGIASSSSFFRRIFVLILIIYSFFFGRPNDSIAAGILLHRRRTPRGAFAPGPWRTRDGQVRRTGQEPSNTMEK